MSAADRRVCVIGAQGVLGGVVLEQFESAGWKVQPVGRRSDPREGFRHVDLNRAETVTAAVGDADLIVSSVPHPEWTAERAVLGEGGVLLNCSHAPAQVALELATEVEEARGTVLLNAGLVPGIANLAAAELLEEHPQADCLEIAFTVLGSGTAGKAGGEFVHHGLTSRRHHRVVTLPLPQPFGKLGVIEVTEGEDGGFGGVAGKRHVETYLGFGDRPLRLALRTLNGLRLISLLPQVAFTVNRNTTTEASSEPTVVWIGARRGAERLGASTIECDGDYRTTAAVARVFGEALLNGPDRPGCFNPEDLFRLNDLLPELTTAGLRISKYLGTNA